MNNSLLNRLTPREPKFFPLLKEQSNVIIRASELLIECFNSTTREDILLYFRKIKEEERKGDQLCKKIFDELNVTFITPFDREDINNLSNRLDDVADGINGCAKRIALYQPKQIPEKAIALAKAIKEGAEVIGKAIDELDVLKKSAVKIKKYCDELHDIEHQADDIYENFIIDMFQNEKDAIEIIKLKDIMYELEKTTDIEEHVAKIIKTIIVKYA